MFALEIILSAQVQKRWRIKPEARASDPPGHWLGQWRVDFGRKSDQTQVALVTNSSTLFTLLLPVMDLRKDNQFERLFRLRLSFLLIDAPALAGWKTAPIFFATGNPRRAVGAMNNMCQHMNWHGESTGGRTEDDEVWINDMPFARLPGICPNQAFTQRLTETLAELPPEPQGGRAAALWG